ncbi:MAG: S-methyl-5-thioribose-1-phosphate isomerase [Anaerolineae bacterium]|nr:S-methyl-5-thioribose-1-phosphate isomerase [Anaerolineae bacterium]
MRTVEWHDNKVRMIDQRLLPWEFTRVDYDDYHAVAAAITDMVVRGAPAIGAAAAFGLALAAHQSTAADRPALLRDLESAASTLKQARPTAVNLAWAVDRLMRVLDDTSLERIDAIRAALLHEAQTLADEDVAINKRMGAFGAALIRDGDTILHHCNTGALATVDWGTALGVVRSAYEQGKKIHVLLDETRPRLQGARLSAWELKQLGIPFDVIADNAAGHFMRTGQVNIVLVGSDRTAANGDVANKIGTYKLGVVARENGIPFYPVVPTSTIDLSLKNGDEIPIEERDPAEVRAPYGLPICPDDYPVRNPAFDVTPHRYVTGIVTENGIAYPPFDVNLRRAVEDTLVNR